MGRSFEQRRRLHILLPLFIGSVLAYLDRVNIAYAALTMNADLKLTPGQFGMGAGIFFAGYVLFEIPGALIAERWSPRVWLARIMVTWGIVSALMALIHTPAANLVLVCITAIGVYSAFGVWWSYPTSFLSGAAAAGAVGLINSCGNVGGYVGPYFTGLIRGLTGSFQAAYVSLACLLLCAGLLMLTLPGERSRQ